MKVKAGLIQMNLKGDTSMSPEEITCLMIEAHIPYIEADGVRFHSRDFQASQGRVDSPDLGSHARPLR